MIFGTTHFRSPSFPDEYVTSLRHQFAPHEITVLGNGADYDAKLIWPFTGWASKIEWFAPWNKPLRPAVVFDLDTYVFDPEPFLALDPTRLWMIRQFYQTPGLGESGIFVAPDNDDLCARIWQAAKTWDFKRGDGALMRQFEHSFIPDVIDGIYSYKVHHLQNGYPADARAVCFHGAPKPPQTDGWAKDRWLQTCQS